MTPSFPPVQPDDGRPSRKILLVEDDQSMADFVITLLERNSAYEVMRAANGLDALRLLSSHKVDLILTDILMPEMDGIELIQKRTELAGDTPVIAFSGGGYRLDQDELLRYAKLFGAQTVLQKPVNPQTLLTAIGSLMGHDR